MIVEELEQLGFGKNEAAILAALSEIGSSSVAELMKKTQIHPHLAYRSLNNLVLKGLVSETIRDHKKYYSLNNTHKLVSEAESRLELAKNVEHQILELNKKAAEGQKITVFQGQKAIVMARQFIINSISDEGMYYILSGNIKEFGKAMGGEFERQEREIAKRSIKQIFLGYKDQIKEFEEFKSRYFKKIAREFYFLDQNSSIPMSVDFSEKRVAILIFGSEPIAIGISDTMLAQGYKKMFETLLSLAHKHYQTT